MFSWGCSTCQGTGEFCLSCGSRGLKLELIQPIPVTFFLTVNPARSTGPAPFAHGWAAQHLWLFWIAPILGAALAGVACSLLFKAK
jgi:aquaporin Z